MKTYLTSTAISSSLSCFAMQDFIDYTSCPINYSTRVDDFSKNFGMTFDDQILSTYYAGSLDCPSSTGFPSLEDLEKVFGPDFLSKMGLNVGDFENGISVFDDFKVLDAENPQKKFVILGINPGINNDNIKFEQSLKICSWNAYKTFHDLFFMLYGLARPAKSIGYYSFFANTLAPLYYKGKWNSKYMWAYCNSHIFSLDIIPYHSKSGTMHPILTAGVYFLIDQFKLNILPLLDRHKGCIEKVIIHNKYLTELILTSRVIGVPYYIKNFSPSKKCFFIKYNDIEFRLFSRFIPMGGFSIKEVQSCL